METLIFNGSPRKNGDTVSLIRELRKSLTGTVTVIDACTCGVSPCVDCRFCWENSGCAIRDGWQEIDEILYRCNSVVIATPIYFSLPTGPLLSLLSRVQQYYCAKAFRGEAYPLDGKRGGLLLTGGGDGSPAPAEAACRTLLRAMGCGREIYPALCCCHTNDYPALEEPEIREDLRVLGAFLERREERT